MADVIQNFPLPLPAAHGAADFTLTLPAEWLALSLSTVRGTPCLWVQVQRGPPQGPHRFSWVTDGSQVPARGRYLGTFSLSETTPVYHLYTSEG